MPGRWLTARPILHPRPRSDSVRRATRSRRCQKIRHVAQSFVVPFRAASACVTWFLCFSAADQSLSSAAGRVFVCVTLGVRRPRPRLLVLVGVCASRTVCICRGGRWSVAWPRRGTDRAPPGSPSRGGGCLSCAAFSLRLPVRSSCRVVSLLHLCRPCLC